tara:strand:+ start:771 stop:941 length:171 start_codon:yes stop_codon:yes gene_type:complete
MHEFDDAKKRKMIKELRKASKLHAGQADTLERSMMKKAKPKPKAKAKAKAKSKRGS